VEEGSKTVCNCAWVHGSLPDKNAITVYNGNDSMEVSLPSKCNYRKIFSIICNGV